MKTPVPVPGVSPKGARFDRLPSVALGLMLLGLSLAGGCASTGDSDMPWNQPQPWEGAPSIPGFSGEH